MTSEQADAPVTLMKDAPWAQRESIRQTDTAAFDVVGVGLGPSNLALAIAIDEHNSKDADRPLSVRFLERQPSFGWHKGMLLEDTTMQVTFLKDLVTLRNPTSSRTFVNYLHQHGRLAAFINQRDFFPSRIEFHDYLEWAAGSIRDSVTYGRCVVSISPEHGANGEVQSFAITSQDASSGDALETLTATNVVLGTGIVPRLPDGVEQSATVWHSSQLLLNVSGRRQEHQPETVAIVGSGQSAAEAAAFLHHQFPEAEILCLMSKYGYTPADDSPFVNSIFDPSGLDLFYDADEAAKQRIFELHANTNYSVVDKPLIDELFRRAYREAVSGRRRLRMLPLRRFESVSPSGAGQSVEVTNLLDGTTEAHAADIVVFATGYRPMDSRGLFGDFGASFQLGRMGLPAVSRSHRIKYSGGFHTAGVYVQGGTEHSHGLSSSLLSNVPVRAGEILADILRVQEEASDVRPR